MYASTLIISCPKYAFVISTLLMCHVPFPDQPSWASFSVCHGQLDLHMNINDLQSPSARFLSSNALFLLDDGGVSALQAQSNG